MKICKFCEVSLSWRSEYAQPQVQLWLYRSLLNPYWKWIKVTPLHWDGCMAHYLQNVTVALPFHDILMQIPASLFPSGSLTSAGVFAIFFGHAGILSFLQFANHPRYWKLDPCSWEREQSWDEWPEEQSQSLFRYHSTTGKVSLRRWDTQCNHFPRAMKIRAWGNKQGPIQNYYMVLEMNCSETGYACTVFNNI